jgi:photosystem II stability/assembly factor-like uncharacterized protein
VGTWFDAGTVERRILRSPDLGVTWCVLSTPEPVSEIAVSPASENVIYALTCAPAGGTARLLKTADGGATWTSPPAGLPEGFSRFCGGAPGVLQTSFTDSAVLWLGEVDGWKVLYRSGDGGESWTLVPAPPALRPVQGALDIPVVDGVVVDPTSAKRAIAWGSIFSADLSPRTERWFATLDAGTSWREIAVPSWLTDPDMGVEVVVDAGSSLYIAGDPSLLRSADWGETWTDAGVLPEPYARLRTLSSSRGGHLLASGRGGDDLYDGRAPWRTFDGGATWTPLDVPSRPPIDPVLAPDGGDLVVGVSAYGMSVTTNGGRAWTARPIVPLAGQLAQSPADRQRRIWAYAGLQSTDGGLTWNTTAGDSFDALLPDGADPAVVFSGVSAGSAGPQRTEDAGRTWSSFALPAGLIAAAATCRSPRSCLYVVLGEWQDDGTQICRLARSDDGGRTWAEKAVPSEICYGIPALAISPEDGEHLVASCVRAVCETRDGGHSWAHHPIGNDPDRPVESILFMHQGIVLATTLWTAPLGNTKAPVLARSTDGGSSWVEVMAEGGDLVGSGAHPETVFLISPRSNAADVLMRSDDFGATWRVASPPLADEGSAQGPLSVFSIADSPRGGFVAATTYGLVQLR